MAKDDLKDITDEATAFERLGVNSPQTPDGDTVSTVDENVGLPQEQEPQEEQADTSAQQEMFQEEEVTRDIPAEQKVSTTQDEQGNITEDEKQRRSWQAEADRAKNEAESLKERIALMQEQNRQLLNVVTPFMSKYGQDGQKPENGGVQSEPQPNFIEDGYFDPQKYQEYQKQRDEWLLTQAEQRIMGKWEQRQNEQTTQQQLQEVARQYPEYVNSLTGELDVKRLENDLKAYTSSKTVTDLVREMKGQIAKPTQQAPNPLGTQESLSAIERNANRPRSAASSSEVEKEKKPVPEKLKKLHDTFGGLELPSDFDGLI